MKKIAIIPARSGSKGLKDKNIIDLCGKPLMAYTIDAARNSEIFERVIVSTDSVKYGLIASEYGAEVMYRDAKLSGDDTSTYMVIANLLEKITLDFDYFVLLQPTSPMRTSRHILESVSLFEKNANNYNFLVSVKESEYAKILINPIEEDGSLKYFDADFTNYKRQAYQYYLPNGAIFIGKNQRYLEKKHFFGSDSLAYKMSKEDSIDIDDVMDYEIASLFMKKRVGGK